MATKITSGALYEWSGSQLLPVVAHQTPDGTALDELSTTALLVEADSTTPPAQPMTVPNLPKPFFAAHRGGNGPEETMANYRAHVNQGNIGAECDVFLNANGSMVLNHDSTVDRTWSNGTGTVSSKTDAQWQAGQVEDLVGAMPDAPAAFWSDLAGEFGPAGYILCPEWKAGGSQYTRLFDDIIARELQEQTIFQSFDAAQCNAAADRGLYAMRVYSGAIPTGDYATHAARGLYGVATASGSATQAAITAAHSAGLRFWAYTVNTTTLRDTLLARDIDGIFTDYPNTLAPLYPPPGTGGSGGLATSPTLTTNTTRVTRG